MVIDKMFLESLLFLDRLTAQAFLNKRYLGFKIHVDSNGNAYILDRNGICVARIKVNDKNA